MVSIRVPILCHTMADGAGRGEKKKFKFLDGSFHRQHGKAKGSGRQSHPSSAARGPRPGLDQAEQEQEAASMAGLDQRAAAFGAGLDQRAAAFGAGLDQRNPGLDQEEPAPGTGVWRAKRHGDSSVVELSFVSVLV